MKVIKKLAALGLIGALAACGGGGSSGTESGGVSGSISGPNGTVSGDTHTNDGSAATSPAGSAAPNDIVDTDRKVDPAAYAAMAAKLSTDEGITYRYGDVAGATQRSAAGDPRWYERPSTAFTKQIRPNALGLNIGAWQVGGPAVAEQGDYFSNTGSLLYVTDANASARAGVSIVQLANQVSNVFSQKPELHWVWGTDGYGTDDYHAVDLGLKRPIAAAHCYGRPGWCMSSIVAYQDGTLATNVHSNTALNLASLKLPANKVPSALTITNGGEFALVTVWDTQRTRAQIAVIALAGRCNVCSWTDPDKGDEYWGEWGTTMPGLPNFNNIAFMKLLGYVDLPESMRAPTEISATTGWNPWEGRPRPIPSNYDAILRDPSIQLTDTRVTPYYLPLSNETNRATFSTRLNTNAYAKGGVAVVISKSEQRAAFVDLKPLFEYYRGMYFGPIDNYRQTQTVGMADGQWPFTFSVASQQTPKLITTVDLPAPPTAVKAQLWGRNPRAWIATQEGQLRLFDISGYADGSGTTPIAQVGAVPVGANPTSLSYFRSVAYTTGNDINDQLLVLSRRERRIDFLSFAADHKSATLNSGPVKRALTDQRMVDPIMIEDNEAHGTDVSMVSVADYNGRALHNYRYAPVVFKTNPNDSACQPNSPCTMGQNGSDPFEYGGALTLPAGMKYMDGTAAGSTLPGKPFHVGSGNVP